MIDQISFCLSQQELTHYCRSLLLPGGLARFRVRWPRCFARKHIQLLFNFETVNLFCSCMLLGEAQAFLFMPEVTRVHPSSCPEVSLTFIVAVDTVCFSTAGGD